MKGEHALDRRDDVCRDIRSIGQGVSITRLSGSFVRIGQGLVPRSDQTEILGTTLPVIPETAPLFGHILKRPLKDHLTR